ELFQRCMNRLLPEAVLTTFFPEDGPDFFDGRSLSEFDAFLWSGSSGTIYDGTPGSQRQIALMQSLLAADRPIWGSCWGMQVATMAAGGSVASSPAGREWVSARRV